MLLFTVEFQIVIDQVKFPVQVSMRRRQKSSSSGSETATNCGPKMRLSFLLFRNVQPHLLFTEQDCRTSTVDLSDFYVILNWTESW